MSSDGASARKDEEDEKGQRKADDVLDERLDFYSAKFDPLLALKCTTLKPPVPHAKTFDNLAMYQSYMKRTLLDGASAPSPAAAAAARDVYKRPKPGSSKTQQVDVFQRRFLPHQMPVPTTKARKKLHNVFTRMEAHAGKEGVFGVLEKARKQRLQVTVQIRHSHGVRGVLTASVTHFDKYWNMTLRHVDEYWIRRRKPRTPAIGAPPAASSARWASHFPPQEVIDAAWIDAHVALDARADVRKLAKMLAAGAHGRGTANSELCHRRVNELLVRGEQVVFIAIAQGRQS